MTHFLSFIKLKTLILFSFFVILCKFSYGLSSSSAEEMKMDTVSKVQTVQPLPKFRIGAQIGYGYRFDRISDSDLPGMNNLKHSLSYGGDLSYYFSKYIGAGIKYNGIYSKTNLSKINPYGQPDGSASITPQSEGIHYIGAFLSIRYFVIPNKHCLFANVGVGYIRYREKTVSINNSKPIKENSVVFAENTLALFPEIGYDFFITKSLAVGLLVSSPVGLLKDRVKVGHVGASLGLRFWK